jgi:hypothetical protein
MLTRDSRYIGRRRGLQFNNRCIHRFCIRDYIGYFELSLALRDALHEVGLCTRWGSLLLGKRPTTITCCSSILVQVIMQLPHLNLATALLQHFQAQPQLHCASVKNCSSMDSVLTGFAPLRPNYNPGHSHRTIVPLPRSV